MKTGRFFLLLAVLLALGASFWLGGRMARRGGVAPAGKPDTVTVTKWVHDTVEVASSEPAGAVAAKLPVVQESTTNAQIAPEIEHSGDISVQDPPEIAQRDSALVEVPIEETTCVGANYRAVIRGFRPELVDIWVRVTSTTIRVPYRKRWSFTVGPQVGIGYTPAGVQPYAGAGVTFGYSF